MTQYNHNILQNLLFSIIREYYDYSNCAILMTFNILIDKEENSAYNVCWSVTDVLEQRIRNNEDY